MTELVVTRFAPSPTGYLHIGGLRTALFNYLYAKRYNGKFKLRIEDTDIERSSDTLIDAIYSGLAWLGLDYDGEPVIQSNCVDKHRQMALKLLESGNAYYCYMDDNEIEQLKSQSYKEGKIVKSSWRDRDATGEAINGVQPVIRLKCPLEGKTEFDDELLGKISVSNDQIEDTVLLRSNGFPTYTLSCVIDDIDMGVNHIIRGGDHVNNTLKQKIIYNFLGVAVPKYVHVPLIHGDDGSKLSKRHGAVDVMHYAKEGILPEAMMNCLLRMGWSHGDDEIFSLDNAIELFDIDGLGKSPSRFDMDRLYNLNMHYIKERDIHSLVEWVKSEITCTEEQLGFIKGAMHLFQDRAKSLNDIKEMSYKLLGKTLPNKDTIALMRISHTTINNFVDNMHDITWEKSSINAYVNDFCKEYDLKKKDIFQPLRAFVFGDIDAPSIMEIILILGKETTIDRIKKRLALALK